MRSSRSKKIVTMVTDVKKKINKPDNLLQINQEINDDVDSTVKFKMDKFFQSQEVKKNEYTGTDSNTCSDINPITVFSPKTDSTVSDKMDYDDSGSSYNPINDIISDDEVESEIESSVVEFAENLNIDGSFKSNSIDSDPIAIEDKVLSGNKIDTLSKSKKFNVSAVVENSKKSQITNKRIWDKKDVCIFCETSVTNFTRHLMRKHSEEVEVAKFMALKKGSKERSNLIDHLRKRGNFFNNIGDVSVIKPVRRPNQFIEQPEASHYLPCKFCYGLYKKNYLRRHTKICSLKKNNVKCGQRQNVQAEAQSLLVAFESEDTKLVEQVFPRMAPDTISLVVKNDPLIRAFGTRYLKCHKEKHLITVVSNKMRELGRFLIAMRQNGDKLLTLQNCLKPELFETIIKSTKQIAGYDEKNDKFEAPSLVLKIGTSLKQCCDIAEYMLLKKSPLLRPVEDNDITNIKTVENLISKQWSYELATNASKELYQKKWNKPAFLPLTSDIKVFRDHLLLVQKNALKNLKINLSNIVAFKSLQESVLAQLILLNRKRAGEVQRIFLNTYLNSTTEAPQEEIALSLSKVENELTKKFKRIVIRGKRGRGVPILFTPKLQKALSVLISVRTTMCNTNNEYLFAVPNTDSSCLRASETIRKLALASGAKNPSAITSTKLRKQVATVAQLLNFDEGDVEQLANFMGHSKDVHKTFYRLPENVFQVAKVSKFLLMMDKGDADQYRGKNLDDINVEGLISDESEGEYSDFSSSHDEPEPQELPKTNNTQIQEQLNNLTEITSEKVIDHNQSTSKTLKTKLRKQKEMIITEKPRSLKITKQLEKKKFIRFSWTEEQKAATKEFFQKHILLKKAPNKGECEDFLNKNKILMSGLPWRKIKTFVYNLYKD